MDPNTALSNARKAAQAIINGEDAGDELADAFEALDGWLTNGGFLPAAWERVR